MNITTIVGARPQFIKAATVSRAFQDEGVHETLIHTGQHSDANMSDVFFTDMGIPRPAHFLGISGLTHGAMTGEMLKRVEELLLQDRPDVVLVYGDTNSTLAGALAAAKLHIPVAHVEAGLRSFNTRMPEEINRTLTDKMSKWLFCPTETACKNLAKEGFHQPVHLIENVGDVMLDATLYYKSQARWPKAVPEDLQSKPFMLCTLHRQESVDDPRVFSELLDALTKISEVMPVVWPVHPRARKAIETHALQPVGLHLLSPVGYFEMLALLEACRAVATDSGGLQKEAYFFRKPCLTLRSETEWTELVEAGANTICGTSASRILHAFGELAPVPLGNNLYGTGSAAKIIARSLKQAPIDR